MDKIEASGANAQQIEFWNGEAGSQWSERDDQMSAMLRPLSSGLVDQPESVRNAIRESVLAAITDRYLDGYVELPAKCWLVTARNPA